ncbi:hypothetical protein DITRI_Ditri18aG0036000 [Diplodiscus trichospermus]
MEVERMISSDNNEDEDVLLPDVSKISSVTDKEWGSAGKGTKTDWMVHEFRLPAGQNPSLSNTKKDNLPEAYASDWKNKKNNPSKQNNTATSSRTCSIESDNSVKNFGVLDDKEMERKLVYDHFLGTTQSHPSYLSYSNLNADQYLGQKNWDDLRPVVDYTLGTSLLYSDW